MNIITPKEWNKLDHDEQERRYKSFVLHIMSLPPQSPVDTGYLVELAEYYKTPVPKKINGNDVDFGEYE